MNRKRYRALLTAVLFVCAAILAGWAARRFTGELATQRVASAWSAAGGYAQVSCFFTEDAAVTEDSVVQIEQKLKTALQEASVDTSDADGRTLVDCYSSKGELTVYSDRTSATVRAFGVGGDFFTFHPLALLSGSYFNSDNDENGDGVILDENVAWQLFGANNVAGMYVEINGVEYPVRGVVRSDSGRFSEAADEESATVYVSYAILEANATAGTSEDAVSAGLPVENYEVLIKNPVKGFGANAVKDALGLDEQNYELVENSARYGLENRFAVLRNFGIRSMNTKNIIFPYWENRARAYEDVSAALLIAELLCLVYPIVYACGWLRWLWKRKTELRRGAQRAIASFFRMLWRVQSRELPAWVRRAKETPGGRGKAKERRRWLIKR